MASPHPATHQDGQDAPLLRVQDLSVVFPTRKQRLVAVDRISFDIRRGEILGVVGESGAGKSITGNALMRLIEPPGFVAGGGIYLDGRRIDQLGESALRQVRGQRIGMVFQDPLTSLNPLYSIGEQLIETIRTHLPLSQRDARQRAIDLLGEVGIGSPESRLDAYPHQFSGGMRQRVVIALALCADPDLVIADEPTTALDVSVQAQILALLKRLCRERGAGVKLITHDMGVIAETADNVMVMYAGRVVERGPVDTVVHDPAHPYTAGLMDSIPPVETDVRRLTQIPGSMPSLRAIPEGCAFHPRCPHAFDRCRRERPDLMAAGESTAACWLYARHGDRGGGPEAVRRRRRDHAG
jgi:peptide/nickel transport system ATP-binding protein